MLDWYPMRVILLLCLASLLALVLFAGTAEPGALADTDVGEEPAVTTEVAACAKGENGRESAGIRITMTGASQDGEADAQHDSAAITITMTGEEDEEDGASASVTLRARTGSPDGG